jgi:uncharacterized protein (TIGR02996 family)
MTEEADFLNAIRANPDDDTVRLVYADWLEERGDTVAVAKAIYLRHLVQRTEDLNVLRGESFGLTTTAQQARRSIADVDWFAVVDKVPVENCQGRRPARPTTRRELTQLRFDFVCDRRWEEMASTDTADVRFCDGCRKVVHYCRSVSEARSAARQGRCVAVDLAEFRTPGDLNTERRMLIGKVAPTRIPPRPESR